MKTLQITEMNIIENIGITMMGKKKIWWIMSKM